MLRPYIYADFNNLDEEPNQLKLTCVGSIKDFRYYEQVYSSLEDVHATFYTDDSDDEDNPTDLCVDGVLKRKGDYWIGIVDWESLSSL